MRSREYVRRATPVARDLVLLTGGALLIALAVDLFLVPNDVVSGGLTGAAQLAHTWLGTPVGLVTLALNIPLLILGVRTLGGFVFGVRTIYATVVMSVAIDLLAPYVRPVTADPLLYTLYGGLLDGIGMGLVFRARGTTGGTDVIARWLELRRGVRPGRAIAGINAGILAGAFFAYGAEKVLYAVLVAFVAGLALDYTLSAGSGARQALIVTSRPDELTAALVHDLGRGVTVIEGRGAYTGADRAVLLCVVARAEISPLRALVAASDPRAFVIIGEVSEVIGEGFRPFG
jgi:uncharacterized membrane-anchored protein YitT (DUF2179 family)